MPVVLAELGWMTMGIVDTLMVGPISPAAIGAVGIGTSLFMGVCIFAMGLMLGLDTLVSCRQYKRKRAAKAAMTVLSLKRVRN